MKKIILASIFLFVFVANANAQFDPELLKDPFLSPSPSFQNELDYKLEVRQPTSSPKKSKTPSVLSPDDMKKLEEYGYIIYTSSDDQMITTSISRTAVRFDNLIPSKNFKETVSINTTSLIYPETQNNLELLSPFKTPSGIEIPVTNDGNQEGFSFLLDGKELSVSIKTSGEFQSGIYQSVLQFTSLPKP